MTAEAPETLPSRWGKYDWENSGSGELHEVSMEFCFGQSFARHQGNASGSAALGVKERCADGVLGKTGKSQEWSV